MAIFISEVTATGEASSPILFGTAADQESTPTQPPNLSRSAGISSIMDPHLIRPQSHSVGGDPVKPARLWTGRYCCSFAQVSQGKEAKGGTVWSSAAHLTLKASEILNSTGPQCTMGRSTPRGEVPQEMPFFLERVISVAKPHRRETKALTSLT